MKWVTAPNYIEFRLDSVITFSIIFIFLIRLLFMKLKANTVSIKIAEVVTH
jgi:hypothetical protein